METGRMKSGGEWVAVGIGVGVAASRRNQVDDTKPVNDD